jgi:hypothetical protein
MSVSEKPLYVTRDEFYGALVVVWMYIMLVLLDLFRLEGRWSTGLLYALSLFMVFAYTVTVVRNRRRSVDRTASLDRIDVKPPD